MVFYEKQLDCSGLHRSNTKKVQVQIPKKVIIIIDFCVLNSAERVKIYRIGRVEIYELLRIKKELQESCTLKFPKF